MVLRWDNIPDAWRKIQKGFDLRGRLQSGTGMQNH
jgi:hypothetical protein